MGDHDIERAMTERGAPARLLLRYVGQVPIPGSFYEKQEPVDMDNLPPGASFEIAPPGLVIGRLPDADVKIVSPYVARHHVRLWPTDDGIRVQDLGSTNGTCVNGTLVTKAVLRAGDRLTIAGLWEFLIVLVEGA
jgi:hypothetical protein